MVEKLDLRKTYKKLYTPGNKEPEIVDVPEFQFLMIDGKGNPNTSVEYQDKLMALYQLAYTMKFIFKKSEGVDYSVMPLEGLWWAKDMQAFTLSQKDDWLWTMMIMLPDFITPAHVEESCHAVLKKKESPFIHQVRLEKFHEGLSVQLMHIGPYSAEGSNIARMHAFAAEKGYRLRDKHHEIYLSDPRRTAPEKLRTVIRQPIRK
jgi:hypothetical protein